VIRVHAFGIALLTSFVASGVAMAAPDAGTTAPVRIDSNAAKHLTVDDAVADKDGVKRMVILRALDKITGRASILYAPIGVPVSYATLTITAHYCYSTPQIEAPETTAFLQISDHRQGQPERQVFSGWMLASSPSLNGMEHPIYDVWVISCKTNQPGQFSPPVASTAPVKPVSPDKGAKEPAPDVPEDSGE
jgi:hypothetical protein